MTKEQLSELIEAATVLGALTATIRALDGTTTLLGVDITPLLRAAEAVGEQFEKVTEEMAKDMD